MATKKGSASWYTVLQFLGSLVFLWVLYSWAIGGSAFAAPAVWFGGAGGFWAPIFGAVAVFGAISLFLVSLMALFMGSMTDEHAKKLATWTGVSFFALTVGGPLFIGTIVAFVLTWFGIGGEMRM